MTRKLLNHFTKLIVLLILVGVYSCEKDENLPKFELYGNVLNTTVRNVKDATVKLFKEDQDNSIYSAFTNNNGEYSFEDVEEGTYILTVNANGYDLTSYYVEVTENTSQNITILGSANISGTIINSQTGNGLSGATVSFTVDQSATNGSNAELQVTTDYYGNYSIEDGPTGTFTGIVEADGFFPRKIENITFSEGYNDIENQTIVEEPEEGTLRIILSWGISPYDLDSHLTGPTETDRFHVYFSNTSHDYDVNLDVDDTNSYGPETITISNFYPGTYRYSVHNYSNQETSGGYEIYQSPAKVEIYDYTGLLETYTAPPFTGYGNTWRVFEIYVSGSYANITTVNSYVQATSSGDMDIFKNSNDKKSIEFDLNDF